ncbi:MAG: hypothetical protein KDA92_08430, partial [Planctomycetales bacterium]|nr:hypothetical protein [Planctomycetales bacterium]
MIVRRILLGLALVMLPVAANAQTFDTLYEYGNAADANATSGAGIARGFTASASGTYTITAGGTDFWDVSDHGSAIFDSTATPVTGDFSAVVKVSIGQPGEVMPGEWGRSGIMARTNPSLPNSAYFASAQKFSGPNQHTLQFRDAEGSGTGNVLGATTTLVDGTGGAGVPVWLGLHRYGDQVFASWAPDNAGAPGTWSMAVQRAASADQLGPVQLGLMHQNHNVQPETSTATFTDFMAGSFDNSYGQFPLTLTRNVGLTDGKVSGQISGVELGGVTAEAVDWKVELLGAPVISPGLAARSFLRGNSGGNFDPDTLTPQGIGTVANVSWFGNSVAPAGFEKYPDVFGLPAD